MKLRFRSGLIFCFSFATLGWALPTAVAQQDMSLSEAETEFEFTQTRTCKPSGINGCRAGEQPQPVQWGRSQVKYQINERGTQVLDPDDPGVSDELKSAVFESFDAWNDQACSDFEMIYDGQSDRDEVGYDQDQTPVNLLVWRDDEWPNPNTVGAQAVALTTVTYNPCNGAILSADIEFNTADFVYTNNEGSSGTQIDFRNTLTHEAGHFLGLDHSPQPAATMFATAPHGEVSKRDLHDADINGLCYIYPAGEDYSLPECGYSGDGGNGDGGGICATTPARPSPTFILVFVALILAAHRPSSRRS